MSKADDSAPKLTNFEEMFSKTRSMAETINKKGAMYLELSRKKIEYMDAKSKLSKAYENFGKLQFSAYIGEEVDENALKERTETLSAELEEAKNKDAEELKKGAEEFRKEVQTASKEARDVIVQQAKDFFRAVQLSVKSGAPYSSDREVTVDFTEVNHAEEPESEIKE